MIHLTALPVIVALNSKVVVALGGKGTSARIGLQQTLRKSYAGRDAVLLHLIHSHVTVSGDICRIGILACRGCRDRRLFGNRAGDQQERQYDNCETEYFHYDADGYAKLVKYDGNRVT
jgi:hypothetical protein